MSVVTNVLLITTWSDEVGGECIAALNEAFGQSGKLKRVSEHAGGHKHSECEVWAGAYNHLDIAAFVEAVKVQPWGYLLPVQLLMREQDGEWFTERLRVY